MSVMIRAILDHLVFAAASLEDGVAWCAATLGVAPAAGGAHPQMGTHNRIFAIASERFPFTYAEILAIDPAAPPPGRPRWFDLDDLELTAEPRLVAFVARTPDLAAARAALVERGLDPGPIARASRTTPRGLLEWQLTIPADGRRLLDGAVPALIQWGAVHPTDSLSDAGIALHSLVVSHPRAGELRAAFAALGLEGVEVVEGAPGLSAALDVGGGARAGLRHV